MVIWTDNAIKNITDFIDEARNNTEETAKAYMLKLVDYVDILETMPEIGKKWIILYQIMRQDRLFIRNIELFII